MSTHKSQNLNLHLWEPNDNFLRTEFNENFAALDTNVKAAQTAAARAQATVDALFVMGSYVATGEEREITVGFYPSLLIIFCDQNQTSVESQIGNVSIFGRKVNSNGRVVLTETGFRMAAYDAKSWYPRVNLRGREFEYIAFR